MDQEYLPAALPPELASYQFHKIAASRVVGSSLPSHVPMRRHPKYPTESRLVGKNGWSEAQRDAQHARGKGGSDIQPRRKPVCHEEDDIACLPQQEDSVLKLSAYRHARALERSRVQERRQASLTQGAPKPKDAATQALELVGRLRAARSEQMRRDKEMLASFAYGE